MNGRKITGPLILLLLLCLISGVVLAQGTVVIGRWSLNSGGGVASGGDVSLYSALGQAVAGSSSGGDIALSSGFWSGRPAHTIYLPVVLRNYIHYAPPCSANNDYCEPYDTWQTAYGPLAPGVAYRAYPNYNHDQDYYYFVVLNPASVTVRVTDYEAVGQVIVRTEDLTEIGKDVEDPYSDGKLEVGLTNLSPGKYYIQLYTTSVRDSHALYTLEVEVSEY